GALRVGLRALGLGLGAAGVAGAGGLAGGRTPVAALGSHLVSPTPLGWSGIYLTVMMFRIHIPRTYVLKPGRGRGYRVVTAGGAASSGPGDPAARPLELGGARQRARLGPDPVQRPDPPPCRDLVAERLALAV